VFYRSDSRFACPVHHDSLEAILFRATDYGA